MSDVEFTDEAGTTSRSYLYSRFEASQETPALVRMLIKANIAKNTSQANIILISTTIIMIVVAIVIYFSNRTEVEGKIPKGFNSPPAYDTPTGNRPAF